MYAKIFPYNPSSLMKPEFVALALGMSYRAAESFIQRSEDAAKIGDQWFLPLWSVEEELDGEEPVVPFYDVCPCPECSKDYKLFIEGPARIVSTPKMR